MRTFTQTEPLTNHELDRLEAFLKSCKGGKAMSLEELDGFSPPSSRGDRDAERVLHPQTELVAGLVATVITIASSRQQDAPGSR
jgi:hypothetical protein